MRTLGLAVGLLLVTGLGCRTGLSDEVGGETHWLSACSEASECLEGHACVCGLCTVTCGSGEDLCGDFGADALCVAPALTLYGERCAVPETRFCGTQALLDEAADAAGDAALPATCQADEADYDGECLDCNAANRATKTRLTELAQDFATCEQDADCLIADASILCGGACAPVARDQLNNFEQASTELESDLCADPIWTGACSLSSVGCEGAVAWCVEGRCEQGDPTMCRVTAQRVDPEQRCLLDAELLGTEPCGEPQGVTWLLDPEGQCWMLQALTAVPSGFMGVDPEEYDACGAGASVAPCTGTCPIRGARLDEERGCFMPSEVIGRFEAEECGSGLIALYTTGRDAEGNCWWLVDGGYPEGFTDVTGSDAACDAQTMQPCP